MLDLKNAKKIFIILSQSQNNNNYLVSELNNPSQQRKISEPELAQLLTQNFYFIFDHAKLILQNLKISPKISQNIICLETLQKITNLKIKKYNQNNIFELFKYIAKNNLKFLTQLECQLICVILKLETLGLPFIKSLWQQKLQNFKQILENTKQEFLKLLPPQDHGFALFDSPSFDFNNHQELKINLEKILKTKLSSTSQNTLKNFSHPAAQLIIKFREHQRMISTYGENFLQNISNNRIHANFEPLGCSSGRISCSNPNLMALPNHPDFQACIKSPENYSLLYFDYGAFELRILAGLSQDPKLAHIFNSQGDIHSLVAQELFSKPVSKTENSNLRAQAKLINFGIIYGMSERALAQNLKISEYQARELLQNYFAKFSQVKDFLYALEEKARNQNYVNTVLGRKLFFNKQEHNISHKLRVARNMPIQGTGADICKLAMISVDKIIQENNLQAGLVNMIHDELVLECHTKNLEQTKKLVSHAMKESFSRLISNIRCEVSVN